jgi:hypothetical protein
MAEKQLLTWTRYILTNKTTGETVPLLDKPENPIPTIAWVQVSLRRLRKGDRIQIWAIDMEQWHDPDFAPAWDHPYEHSSEVGTHILWRGVYTWAKSGEPYWKDDQTNV